MARKKQVGSPCPVCSRWAGLASSVRAMFCFLAVGAFLPFLHELGNTGQKGKSSCKQSYTLQPVKLVQVMRFRVVFEKGFLPQNQKLKNYSLINSFKLKKNKILNLSSISSADLLQAVNSYPFSLLLQACLGECRSSEVLDVVSYLCRKRCCVGRLSFRYRTVTET